MISRNNLNYKMKQNMEQQAQDDDMTWEGRPWVSAGKLKDKNYLGHNNTPDLFNSCRMVTAKWHCKTIPSYATL